MASLNIPFLVFSRSNFVFESDDSCYSGLITGIEDESNFAGGPDRDESILVNTDFCGEAVFFTLDVDSRTIVKRGSDEDRNAKTYKSFFHLLLHPKLLLIPSISMKERVGTLLDAAVVKSPAKYILSTSDYLWVTLHSDSVVRIWNISDGRCLMWSPKELFL